jgi:hypothetical protein
MKWFIPVFSVFVLNSTIAKADCSYGEEVDLRRTNAAVFNQLPISNQGNYGVCYAHAASTIIDFHRLSKSQGQAIRLTDPLAAAIISTSAMAEMSIDGGNVCDVVDGQKQFGFGCSASGVTSNQVRDLGNNFQRVLVEQVFMPYIVKQSKFEPVSGLWIDPTERKKQDHKLSKNQKQYLDKLSEAVKTFERMIMFRGIPRDRFQSNSKLAEFFQKVYINNTWASFEGDLAFMVIRQQCLATKYKMPVLSCTEHDKGSSDLLGVLDDGLKKRIPLGATICANFLTNKKYMGANRGSTVNRDCNQHAVVIIGKRERSGSCEYLIRNSWGSSQQYDWPTSAGDVWVNQFSLLANMSKVQMVK